MSYPAENDKRFFQVLDSKALHALLNFHAEFKTAYGSKTWVILFTLGHNVIHKNCAELGTDVSAEKMFRANFLK